MSYPVEPRSITIQFQPLGRRAQAVAGTSILTAARQAGLALLSVCGGAGLCDSCRIRVISGRVTAPTSNERERLDAADLANGFRLACQSRALDDIVVDVPAEAVRADQRLQLECDARLDPLPASPAGAPEPVRAPASVSVRPGLAIDVGTTKMAAYLVDRASGRTLAAAGAVNPQVAYGEDVISRVAYADAHPEGTALLHRLVVDCANELVARLCLEARLSPEDVGDAVIVGNTVMHHLFVGLSVRSLGRAPYAPVVRDAVSEPVSALGLRLAPDATAYLPPNIAGYVGSDHVAVLVATGVKKDDERVRLIVDVGTNTEVSLVAGGSIVCCSCASGPAFEGAHIGCGMRAAAGAIERVRVVGGEVHRETIGGVPPVGICGSGMLDAVAQLAAHEAVDRHGGFRADHPLVSSREGRSVFVLAAASETGHNRELALTRRDISELQLAKAAIRVGIDAVLARIGIDAGGIDQVVVAGAFGSYIDLASARRVGMFPDIPASRFVQVGNAAGAGARHLLISPSSRVAAQTMVREVEHLDLTADPDFMQRYAAALAL